MAWSSESAVNSQLIEFHSIPASQGRNKGLHLHVNLEQNPSRASAVRPGASAVRSQVEDYRAKAKECARLTVVTKSLREGRRYRKLAEMYWALALGEESHSVRSLKMSEIVMTTYPTEFHRRFEQKWNIVLTLRRFMRAHGECLGCWKSGEHSVPSWTPSSNPSRNVWPRC